MERAIKKRLYVYTIGMFLATVVVVSVITIYYEYRVRYMATTLYGVNKEAGKHMKSTRYLQRSLAYDG